MPRKPFRHSGKPETLARSLRILRRRRDRLNRELLAVSRRIAAIAGLVLLAVAIFGCAAANDGGGSPFPARTAAAPSPVPANLLATHSYLILSPDVGHHAAEWVVEAQTRFVDPFVVIVHGADNMPDEWTAVPGNDELADREATSHGMPDGAMEFLAWTLHRLMPDRPIVYVTCNEFRLPLPVPNAWHARRGVWSCPARFGGAPDAYAASIDEFVCDWKPAK